VLRHEFRPGKLVAGFFLALAGVIYAGDAGGLWETPWFAVIPVVTGGLCLAGAVGVLTRGIRRRRAAVARKGESEAQLDAPGP
jgi:drug/metabolite transporter (DMT)-like permease